MKTTFPLIAMTAAGCTASNLMQMHVGEMILGGGLAGIGHRMLVYIDGVARTVERQAGGCW